MTCPKCTAPIAQPVLPQGPGRRMTVFVSCPCKAEVRFSTCEGWDRWYLTGWKMNLANELCPRMDGPDQEAFKTRFESHRKRPEA